MIKTNVATAPSSAEIRRLLDGQRYREAVLRVARMHDLGPQRDRILSAREAYNRPDFQRQIGRDPDVLIADGIAALRERFEEAS